MHLNLNLLLDTAGRRQEFCFLVSNQDVYEALVLGNQWFERRLPRLEAHSALSLGLLVLVVRLG